MIFFVIIECKVSTIYLKFVQIRAKYEKKSCYLTFLAYRIDKLFIKKWQNVSL